MPGYAVHHSMVSPFGATRMMESTVKSGPYVSLTSSGDLLPSRSLRLNRQHPELDIAAVITAGLRALLYDCEVS